ncbi:hypothetical protein ABIE08_002856 [Kaistia defluvii]|uniref:Uncharacterized protein n=1 Tax=Kaistia defluvii TaxID=410841 RepID=A0ABV2R0V7_9HYPH
MSLIRIILARALFWCVVKLIEAEERALGLAPLKQERER